jgi:hypothetical protein
MKYYETSFDDYLKSNNLYNIHPELEEIQNRLPRSANQMENIIVYGPPGVGKYTQTLKIISKYSESLLKYDKKLEILTDKQDYIMRFSDIHYEIDMSLLGCNAKTLWHEIFFQIVDIVSTKKEKIGIILCKNFHHINSELLDVFYSYIQHYDRNDNIQIKFVLITEQISFIPNKMTNICDLITIPRLENEPYEKLNKINDIVAKNTYLSNFTTKISTCLPEVQFQQTNPTYKENAVFKEIDSECINNLKEMKLFTYLNKSEDIPDDTFDIICDKIINSITDLRDFQFTQFRDTLYDILIYNIDIFECVWVVVSHFVTSDKLSAEDCSDIMIKTFHFFKQYNNNYRPIYHLESMMLYIINKLHHYEIQESV